MIGLGIALFVCIWAGVLREMKNAPEVDELGNIIEHNGKKK